ncbi:MAG: hypothetical protein ACRD8A_08745 [Candidatus Acidiferrales bacterium]
MIWSKKLGELVLAAMAAVPLQAAAAQQRPAHSDKKTAPTVVVWIREIHHQTLYWVGSRPVQRAPLSGIVAATESLKNNYSLVVIIDSHVPIEEMAEFSGLTAKLDVSDVRYYVYDPDYPKAGMSEIVWRTQTIPLPGTPPREASSRASTQ